uniref:Bile acid-CoA:amino acid N-acyltransferase-like n=1 Tax=Scleropages formosus TaxID=113540 RepID=A0A8C9WK24_SCLFO
MRMSRIRPLLTVQPCRGLVDEKFQISVKYLPPKQEVTLHSLLQSEDNNYWEAFGYYVSDAKGAVKVAEDASVGGTYEGIEAMGLLWSMRPEPGSKPGLRLRKENVESPVVVQISVYKGHLSQGFRKQVALACSTVERWYMAPGVQRVDVTDPEVRGTLFLPPGPGPFPAVLDIWGGSGGLVEYRSALLASHGFASMTLEYMPYEGRKSDVNMAYFEKAFGFLQEHFLVDSKSVALLGLSFGCNVCLSMAVYSEVVQPKCCVCISGTHLYPVKSSTLSVLKELEKQTHKIHVDEKNRTIMKGILLPVPTDPNLKTEVGKIKCPLLFIIGLDDENWPVAESMEDMQKMMEEAGNSHLLTALSYPGAGHLIEIPYTPHCRTIHGQNEFRRVTLLWGGRTKPHADAQEHSWGEIIEFLQKHLYSGMDPEPLLFP